MAYTSQILYQPMQSIDSSTFTGSYQALGTPLVHPSSIIKVVNNSNVDVTVSTDGINAMDFIPANSFFLYDCTTNTPPSDSQGVYVPKGTQYLVKGSAGVGLVYLVIQYIPVN
jgi:hypothetical protein